jgi:hypothetical protein
VALAPLWLLERSITMWIALAYRLRGGIPYPGNACPETPQPMHSSEDEWPPHPDRA